MLSYRQYKLNESLMGMGPITLGLRTPSSLGVVGSQLGDEETLEEAKKKKKLKKKMNGDEEIDDEDIDDEDIEDIEAVEDDEDVDDEEVVDDEVDDDDGEVDVDDVEDEDDEDMEDRILLKGKDKGMFMCKDGSKKKHCKEYMKKEKGSKKKKKSAKKKMKTEEDQTWWTSVQNMMDASPNEKFWDGMSPQPGEPGFAPQGRVGDNFS